MKRAISLFLTAALVCGALSGAASAAYQDAGGHWAEEAIVKWEYSDAFGAADADCFEPDRLMTGPELSQTLTGWFGQAPAGGRGNTVSRQEAVEQIARAAGLEQAATGAEGFSDRAQIAPATLGWVNAMAQAGYVGGCGGKFSPDSPISRAEVLTILDRMSDAAAQGQRQVRAAAGTYTGALQKAGLVKFSNITYATAQRWQAPQALPDSAAAVDATAAQSTVTVQGAEYLPQRQDEHTLTLDVYVNPRGESDEKAVFVWNTCGGGTKSDSNSFDPTRLVAEHPDVIAVVANIRVGYFGCIDLSLFPDYAAQAETYQSSNNLMRLDYLEALKWVNKNIAAFGGDPGNVTIAGQSAGAANASSMLLMDQALPYFQKVVMESGVAIDRISLATLDESRSAAEIFRESTGASTLAQALELEPQAFLDAQKALTANCIGAYMPDSQSKTFTTVVDGVVVDEDYWSAIERAAQSGIQILVGTTNGEYDRDLAGKTAEEALGEIVAANWGKLDPARGGSDQAQALIQGYVDRSQDYGRDTLTAYKDLKNDINQKVSAALIAEAFAKDSTAYLFSYEYYAENPSGNRATHGSEKTALYGPGSGVPSGMGRAMRAAWASFALYGDPNRDNAAFAQAGLTWKPYDTQDHWTMVFDETMRLDAGQRLADVESLMPLFAEYGALRG